MRGRLMAKRNREDRPGQDGLRGIHQGTHSGRGRVRQQSADGEALQQPANTAPLTPTMIIDRGFGNRRQTPLTETCAISPQPVELEA